MNQKLWNASSVSPGHHDQKPSTGYCTTPEAAPCWQPTADALMMKLLCTVPAVTETGTQDSCVVTTGNVRLIRLLTVGTWQARAAGQREQSYRNANQVGPQ
jgi:hypothetical protein